MPDQPITMNFTKAEQYSGLSRYHLLKAIAAGKLTAVTIPGCKYPRVRRDELDALIAPKVKPVRVDRRYGLTPVQL